MMLMTALVAALIALPVAAFARPIIEVTFGERYASATGVLRLLALAAIPGAPVLSALPVLGLRQPVAVVRALVAATLLNIGANVVAIPSYGASGAAVTNLCCQVGLAGALLWIASRGIAEARDRSRFESSNAPESLKS